MLSWRPASDLDLRLSAYIPLYSIAPWALACDFIGFENICRLYGSFVFTQQINSPNTAARYNNSISPSHPARFQNLSLFRFPLPGPLSLLQMVQYEALDRLQRFGQALQAPLVRTCGNIDGRLVVCPVLTLPVVRQVVR